MSYSAANALDYKGFPADKRKTGGWIASALILGMIHSLFMFFFLA